jgi:hypothetical protein
MIGAFIRLWDRRETGESLALVRICVGLVILFDFSCVLRLGLVEPLWAPVEAGGFGPATYAAPVGWFFTRFGASAAAAWWLALAACAAASSLCIGFATRSSALVLLFVYGQLAQLSPAADRGIDNLLRNALLVLVCSGAGSTWSLQARLRHGSWSHATPIAAWPRYLIVAQLVLMYFFAGILKQAAAWNSLGGYSALFLVLVHPHYTRFEFPRELLSQVYPLLQLSAALTMVFERGAIALPWLLWLRDTRARGGVLRTLANRARLIEVWLGLGATFHLLLAATLTLGIFPWGCLALYPAFAPPQHTRTLASWLGRRLHRALPTRPTREPTQAAGALNRG